MVVETTTDGGGEGHIGTKVGPRGGVEDPYPAVYPSSAPTIEKPGQDPKGKRLPNNERPDPRATARRAAKWEAKVSIVVKGGKKAPTGLVEGQTVVLEAKAMRRAGKRWVAVDPLFDGEFGWSVVAGPPEKVRLDWIAVGDLARAMRDEAGAKVDPTVDPTAAPPDGEANEAEALNPGEARVTALASIGKVSVGCTFFFKVKGRRGKETLKKREAKVQLTLLPSEIQVDVHKRKKKNAPEPITFIASQGLSLEAAVTPRAAADGASYAWTCPAPFQPESETTPKPRHFIKPELGAGQAEARGEVGCQVVLSGRPVEKGKGKISVRAIDASIELALSESGPYAPASEFRFLGAAEIHARVPSLPDGVTVKWRIRRTSPAGGATLWPKGQAVRVALPESPDWSQKYAFELRASLIEEGEVLFRVTERVEDGATIELITEKTGGEWLAVRRVPPVVGLGAKVRARLHGIPPEIDIRWELTSEVSSDGPVETRSAQEEVELELPVAGETAERIEHTLSAGLLYPGVDETASSLPTIEERITWLYEPPKDLNSYVNSVIGDLMAPGSGKTDKGYALHGVASYSGVTEDLYYKGEEGPERVARGSTQKPGASYCSGITFEVWLRACAKAAEKPLGELKIQGLSADALDVGDFHKRWYIITSCDGPRSAFELYPKLGRTVAVVHDGGAALGNPEEAAAGDFVQIWRLKPDGHTVVFVDWLKADGQIVGVRCWSANTGTNGIGVREEKLKSHRGRVREIHVARAFVPPIEE